MRLTPYISIVFFTFLISICLFNSSLRPKAYGDGEYYEGAKYIVSGQFDNLEVQKGLITTLYYVPPIFIAGVEKNENCHLKYAIIWNQIINIISLAILFFATKNRYGHKTGILVILLSFLLPIHIYYGMGIIAEPAAYFFVSIAYLGWSKCSLSSGVNQYTILLIVGLSLLLNVRQNFQVLIGILFIPAILSLIIDNIKPFRYKYWSLFVSVALLSISLNLLTYKFDIEKGQFKSFIIKISLVMSRYQLRDEPFNWIFWEKELRKGSVDYENYEITLRNFRNNCGEDLQGCNFNSFLTWWSQDILSNKLITLRQCSMKVLQSYSFLSSKLLLSGWNINYKFILIHIFINLVNYTVLILFIMFLINNRSQIISNWIYWGMLIAPYLWIICLFSESRYVFPARPLVFIGAAVFLSNMHNNFFEIISKRITLKLN